MIHPFWFKIFQLVDISIVYFEGLGGIEFDVFGGQARAGVG
jgi:hypothetical protein